VSPSQPSYPALEPPRFARFRVVRELGSGAQGTVHEAIDVERDARVALKTLRKLGAGEIVRLKSEFRAVRDLRHPNLVRLGELVEEGGRWFFTMELVDGVDFLEHVRGPQAPDRSTSPTHLEGAGNPHSVIAVRGHGAGRGPAAVDEPPREARAEAAFDEKRLRHALGQLAVALAFLHEAGKVHRDLKPSNVLVDRDGRVVLIDFGVVAERLAHDEEPSGIVGTVPYMAPEQVLGEPVGPEADWYAVGVLLFEALTGRRPFEGSTNDVMERKCSLDPPRPSDLVPDLPADLEALCSRLIARERTERATDAEVLAALGVPATGATASFVGRHRELDALAAAYRGIQNGGSIAVVLEGESGVGKSALARRFLERLRADEPRLIVLDGRCHEQERVPYNAFDAVIDQLARFVGAREESTRDPLLPLGIARASTLFPVLGVIETASRTARPPAVGPRALRAEAFAVLREMFVRVGAQRPLVILLEDVQWADADSLALLEALTETPGAPRMLLLATARTRPEGGSCAAVASMRGDTRRITLEGLRADEASELVERLVAGRIGSPSFDAASIVESSRGHPMFIEELVRYLAQPNARTGAVALDDALWARVASLAPEARQVLALVAAAGMPIAQGTVADAAGIPFTSLAEHAATLHAAKLVRLRGGRPDDPVEPFHDRVREAVYARVDARERASMHAALGHALEGRRAGPELLFRHFAAANDAARAARYAEIAAENAARALAFDRAAALYENALALGGADPTHRRRLLTSLGDALTDAGRSKEAAESFLAASATRDAPPNERLELLRRAGEQFLMSGHLEPGLAATREVLGAFGLSLPTSRLVALARVGWYQLRLGLAPLAWPARRADEVGAHDAARMDLCWSVGAGLGLVDSVRSMLFLDLGALLALARGDEARIARALGAAAVGEAGLGRRAAAERLGAACRRAAESEGSSRARFYGALTTLTHRFFLDNDWHGCLDESHEALRLWRASGHVEGWEADVVEQFACWSLDNIGSFRELRERVPAKIRAARRAGNRFIEVNFRTQFVHLQLTRDRPAQARRDVEDAIASWPRVDGEFANQDYLALRNLTYVALYAGDVSRATAMLPTWQRYFASLLRRVTFLRQDALWFVGAIALARAAAAREANDPRENARRLRDAGRAADDLARIDLPMARASMLHLRAAIAHGRGDEGAAIDLLREALRHADARGTVLNAACLRARLGAIVGGDEGRALRRACDEWMREQDVQAPERLIGAVLPGF
jgi:serine/threonine protein kinase